MRFVNGKRIRQRLDLQAKIILVLIAVIVPTFLIVTIAQNKFTLPILEDEMRQIGVNSGKTIAAEIVSGRLLSLPNPQPAIENSFQEILFSQPNVVRIDVLERDQVTGLVRIVGSNIEEEPGASLPAFTLVDSVTSEYKIDEQANGYWEVTVPIEHHSRDVRGPKRILGAVHLVVSTKLIGRIAGTLWRTTATAAAFSVVTLILALSYFLRKTISNDRLLKQAESHNLHLTEQLHDTQRQLMNTEKLAVMGQLTASFAHEIGTPLNAVGGHLQLLKEEVPSEPKIEDRLEIINGQLSKIETIVKSFLQSTAKPVSQTQLVDLNHLADKTLGIVNPRLESLGVEVKRHFDREMGPVRVVPLEVEQILLNLVNNSLDSIKAKADGRDRGRYQLDITTALVEETSGKPWAQISVYDTGEGIRKADLPRVVKPFFTTKRPGEGTGLGLAICLQLAHKYGGELKVDSREGSWTRVTLRLPYESTV